MRPPRRGARRAAGRARGDRGLRQPATRGARGPARAPARDRARARRLHDPRQLDPGGDRGRARRGSRPRGPEPRRGLCACSASIRIPPPEPTLRRSRRGCASAGRGPSGSASGARGSVFADAAGCVRLTAPAPERAVNAVGCGDALIGGFAAALVAGRQPRAAIALGAAAATDKVAHLHPGRVDRAARRGARAAGRADAHRRPRRGCDDAAQLRPAGGRGAQPRRDRGRASRLEPEFGQVERLAERGTLTVGASGAIVACGAARLGMRTAYVGVAGDDGAGRFIVERARLARGRRRALPARARAGDRAQRHPRARHRPGNPDGARGDVEPHRRRRRRRGARRDRPSARLLAAPAGRPARGARRALRSGARRGRDDVARSGLGSRRRAGRRSTTCSRRPTSSSPTTPRRAASPAPGDPEGALAALAERVETVVVTLGAEGAIARRGAETARAAAPAVAALDATGAGDNLAAGFLCGLARGLGLARGPGARGRLRLALDPGARRRRRPAGARRGAGARRPRGGGAAMSGPRICFVGAGSVEFTGMLIADILGYPELRDAQVSLHDIDAERLETAAGVARATAEQLGAEPGDRVAPRAAPRARGRGLRDQHDPGRRPRRHGDRPRDPGPLRPPPDDRRHARRRRRLPRPADDPGDGGHRRRHGRALPGGVAPQLHEPDGDALLGDLRRDPAEADRRPVPLGPEHQRGARGARRRAARGDHVPRRRRQPPGVHPAPRARGRGPLPAPRRGDRARPGAAAPGAGARCTGGSATSRPSRASTRPSTCPG